MFFGPVPQCRVEEKEGLLSELRLAWTHRVWDEKCVLAKEDKFAKGLAVSTIFRGIFGDFCCGGELLNGGDAFLVTLRAAVNFPKFLVHSILIYSSNF